jgi:thioredoxin 1
MSGSPDNNGNATSAPVKVHRLWLAALILGLAVLGVWYSTHRSSDIRAENIVLNDGRPKLIDFGMGICEQCKRMKSVMADAARELAGRVDVHVVDIRNEANERLAENFGVRVIPLVVLADGAGKELWRHEGFVDYPELSKAVKARLGANDTICAPTEDRCGP